MLACACELRPERTLGILLYPLSPRLPQGLSLSLELGWQPVSPSDSAVSTPNRVGVGGGVPTPGSLGEYWESTLRFLHLRSKC